MERFLDALATRVLVCDGAMGTMLYAKGVFVNRSFDELNLTHPELVAEIHREYVVAGADVIETNTFGANRFKLATFGLADDVARINREGAVIAKRAAQGRAWVAGSIGPIGVRIEPWGRTSVEEAEAAFRDQARALVEGGVDLFMLETFRDLNEIRAAIRALRAVSALPIVAQVTTGEDGHTLDGAAPETFTPTLEQAGADVIGLNCAVGPAAMLETVEAMARLTSARLSAQPNAGLPRNVDGRNLYLSSPEYLASYARRFISAGVRLVGGCCGTTPEHTRQIAEAVRTAARPAERAARHVVETRSAPAPVTSRRDKSAVARAFADRRFVVIVEVEAPRGADLRAPLGQARRFHDRGAAAVNVPDYLKSGARASALALAALVEQSQVETVLHYACRDRALVAMQSDLVGAHALGVRNLLVTTGIAPRGSSDASADSAEIDAIGLLNVVGQLNRGVDVGGESLGLATSFHVGAAFNPFAADEDAEWRRLGHKIAAGAEFLVTPPIFDVEAFEPARVRLRATGLPIVAGLAALEGVRHAEFLASEVAGVRVAARVLDRLRAASDEAAEALAITVEIARHLAEGVDGLHITSFHGSPATAERVLDALDVAGRAPALERAGRA